MSTASSTHVNLGIALDGAGWHPAAWREPSSRPDELFAPDYWLRLIRIAEQGLADFVTIDDSLALQSTDRLRPDARTDQVRGRLDALLLAAHLSPLLERIGLIPTVTTTFTEPFHVAKAVATLDYTSGGHAGVQLRVSAREEEFSAFGRREWPFGDETSATEAAEELFREAVDVAEVIRRLWDSWEDDAIIRDAATDRFIDRDKLHAIGFASERFSIRGPLTVPRPPQGQPVVAALAHGSAPYWFAAHSADLVFTTPDGVHARSAESILTEIRGIEATLGRSETPLRVWADYVVFLDGETETGAQRRERLDALGGPIVSDAAILTGSAAEVADRVLALQDAGFDGVRLRPGVATDDLPRISEQLVPELQRRGRYRSDYPEGNLRGRLGLPAHPANRFAAAAV